MSPDAEMETLLRRLSAGERGAWGDFCKAYGRQILRLIAIDLRRGRLSGRDRFESASVYATTMRSILEGMDRRGEKSPVFESPEKVIAYLRTSWRRKIQGRLRRPPMAPLEDADARVVDDKASPLEEWIVVDDLRLRLKPGEREVFARLQAGDSPREIAARLEVSLATAYRIIESIRERLKDDHDGER